MYNLLVGFRDGRALRDRVVEYTDNMILSYIAPNGHLDTTRLVNLPTLMMPETGLGDRQVARIGHVENVVLTSKDYRFRFVPNPAIPEIPSERIQSAAGDLDISDWEFNRTHWAVKDVDVYRVVHEVITNAVPTPRLFQFPIEVTQESDIVAVMMPFDARFNPVYDTLREAAEDTGLRCYRADDIWEHDHIMNDVVSLIWRSRVVISDFTLKNPNVFYETGIAHSIGRDVIQITQSIDDVPFDLRAIRSVQYLSNGEGLQQLKRQVADRLRDLVTRPVVP
jgi:hypothetical protein